VKPFLTILACAALLAAQPPAATAPPTTPGAGIDPGTVVLTVGNRQITAKEYEQIIRATVPLQVQPFALGPGKRAYSQRIVEMLVLGAEGERRHLDQTPAAQAQIGLQRRTTLSVHEFQKIASEVPVTDAQAQSFYDSNQPLYTTIHVRHILVRFRGSLAPPRPGRPDLTDNEALEKVKAIRARLVAGEDFAKVAREESDDSSAEKGGDMGEIGHGRTVAQFETAAFALKPGDFSEPVRTPYGYHIIQVQSRSVKPLAEVKSDVVARLQKAAAPAVVKAMIEKAGYHLDEEFFGPNPAPPAAPPTASAPSLAPPTAPTPPTAPK
jgi:parvulin-like peptidyl-prolyl isomerase